MADPQHPRFAGIGGHHSPLAKTEEWYTPPALLEELGPFDLDPCAPEVQPYPTALAVYTKRDNGLIRPWRGRVWLNPPYSTAVITKWLGRMADHDHGTALIFARTETDAFFRFVWERAAALLFMRGRITFHVPDGSPAPGNAGAPTVLCAYGVNDADVLAACGVDGHFVPLRFPRSVLGALISADHPSNETAKSDEAPWRELLAGYFASQDGPVRLSELYAAFATHPKAGRNPNYQAKLRQQLQAGAYTRLDRGLWDVSRERASVTTVTP